MSDDRVTREIALPHAPTPAAGTKVPTLLEAAVAYAREVARLGVREQPPKSNRGPEVDEYLRSVRLDPAQGRYPWCSAFMFYTFERAARSCGVPNPYPRTPGAMKAWSLSDEKFRIGAGVATRGKMFRPGQVFVIDHHEGKGHVGIIVGVPAEFNGTLVQTVEGNTDPGGSREGDGVYERTRVPSEFFGVLDFGR